MNQEKIGKLIAENRKQKNMTQQELADKLGVTDKAISKWENGRCMPDLSLFKPLCDNLDITINDLMSGEKISKEKYQQKFEENVIESLKLVKQNTILERIKNILKVFFTILLSFISVIIFLFIIYSYNNSNIQLKKDEVIIEICDHNSKYFAITIIGIDGYPVTFDINKDVENNKINVNAYRTRKQINNPINATGTGSVLIEKKYNMLYFENELIWSNEKNIEKCNE